MAALLSGADIQALKAYVQVLICSFFTYVSACSAFLPHRGFESILQDGGHSALPCSPVPPSFLITACFISQQLRQVSDTLTAAQAPGNHGQNQAESTVRLHVTHSNLRAEFMELRLDLHVRPMSAVKSACL